MKDPAAADLVRNIKGFIRHFDERSSKHIPNLDTDSAAVQDFFIRMESLFRAHPAWRGAGPEVIDQAIEGLEKYVMSKIWPRTFAASSEDRDRDERYFRLAQALSFVNLTTLMGGSAEVVPDEALVASAIAELVKMDRYKAPRDKLLCLVNVKTLVEDIVGEAVRRGASIGGADAFFPVFLLVVIHARLPRLASNIDYIRRFRARSRLTGQFDYMLCNIESTAMYLDTSDWQHLGVTRNFFLERLAEAGIPEAAMELRALEKQKQQEVESSLLGEKSAVNTVEGDGGNAGAVPALRSSQQETFQAAADVAPSQQKNLRIDVFETVDHGRSGSDVRSTSTTNAAPASITADGLTPLGAGPQTPIILKKQRPATDIGIKEELQQQIQQRQNNEPQSPTVDNKNNAEEQDAGGGGGGAGRGSCAAQVIEAMVADGTHLVLEEEAEGRLQQRHPWIYAAAEDLNIANVCSLLAEYRDLVLKYEALTLSLQQQVSQNGAEVGNRNQIPSKGLSNAISSGGNALYIGNTAQSSGSISESAGSLIHKLASWGSNKSSSGRQLVADGSLSEAAADSKGKAADIGAVGASGRGSIGGTGVDTRLLHSLFGSNIGQQKQQQQQQAPELDLLGDLETEVEGKGGENNEALGSPALGLLEETQQPSVLDINESLI
jgi:hypothetical protein